MRPCSCGVIDDLSRPLTKLAHRHHPRSGALPLACGLSVALPPFLLLLAAAITVLHATAFAQGADSETEALERQLRACESALERREGVAEIDAYRKLVEEATSRFNDSYLELQRLRTELGDRREAEAAANAALDSWTSTDDGPTLDQATALVVRSTLARLAKEKEVRAAEERMERARDQENDAELNLSMLETRLGVQGRDADSIREQCDRLRARLRESRALAGASPTPTAAGGWGLEEGRSWTGQAPEPTPSREDWWHETGGAPGDNGRTPTPPVTAPRRTPAAPTPAPGGPSRPPNRTQLDIGAGPYHEFAALCRLGWASTLAEHSVGPADASIAGHLRMAGEHLRAANLTTFDPLRAWPDWASRKRHYDGLADRVQESDAVFRRQLANELATGWSGVVDDLAWQLAGELQHRENCDSHYARLGYTLCAGQQALQIAEVAEREGDRDLAQRTTREGRDRLVMATREIEALPTVRLASGRCIDLGSVLLELDSSRRGDLHSEVAAADAAFAAAVRLLAGAAGQAPPAVAIGNVAASGWTWGANLNADVLFTPPEPFTITGVRRCVADWSPNPQPCQSQTRTRSVGGAQRTFCCGGFWLTGRISVPGQETVVIQWPDTGQNRVPVPAGTTVNLGSLYLLAATRGDFDNDAVFALILGLDASGRPAEVEGPVFVPHDRFPSYQEMCRSVGSAMSP